MPLSLLKLLTWEEIEIRACGDKVLDIEKLKKITNYYVRILILLIISYFSAVQRKMSSFKDSGEF